MAAAYPQEAVAYLNDDVPTEVTDWRMPHERHLGINPDLKDRNIVHVKPNGTVDSFYRSEIGQPGKICFNLVAKTNEKFIDWTKSYIEFGCKPCHAANTVLDATELGTWGYLPPSRPEDRTNNTTNLTASPGRVKFIHWPGSHSIFKKFTLVDMSGAPIIDELEAADVWAELNMSGNKPEFYEATSTCRSDDYGAAARDFVYEPTITYTAKCATDGKDNIAAGAPTDHTTFYTSNYSTPSRMLPWRRNQHTKELVAVSPTTKNADGATMAADNNAPLADVIRTANQMVNGKKFKAQLPLSFMRTNKFFVPAANPAQLIIELATYGEAFYGVNSTATGGTFTYVAEVPGQEGPPVVPAVPASYTPVEPGAWTQSAYGVDYHISEIRLVLATYEATPTGTNKMDMTAGIGYWYDYSRVRHYYTEHPASRYLTYRFEDKDVHDLQKVIMVIREASNVRNDASCCKSIFTNGELTAAGAINATTGAATDTTTYEGVTSMRWRYGGQQIPTDNIRMGPHKFKNIRDITAQVFPGGDDDMNIIPFFYEGLKAGEYTKHCATKFWIGWNFQKQDWAYRNGLDLSKDTLVLDMQFQESGVAKYIDFFLVYGTQIKISDSRANPPEY